MTSTDEDAVENAVRTLSEAAGRYLDALYYGDTEMFSVVMHPRARLFSVTEGSLVEMDLPGYLDLVRSRPSPASRQDVRQDEVLSIEVASSTTAHVRVRNSYPPKRFTDDLTFIYTDGQWRIIAKVWHYVLADPGRQER
jgi:hypothetical protein